MDKKIKSKEESKFLDKNQGIKAIVLIAIGVVIGLSVMFSSKDNELSNNVTLIVEIGVGIIIALVVFRTTKKSEKQNQKTLDKIPEIENEQSDLIKEMKPILENQEKIVKDQAKIIKGQEILRINKRIVLLPSAIHEYVEALEKITGLVTQKDKESTDLSECQLKLNQEKERWKKLLDNNRNILTANEIVTFETLISNIDVLISKIKSNNDTSLEIKFINFAVERLPKKFPKPNWY